MSARLSAASKTWHHWTAMGVMVGHCTCAYVLVKWSGPYKGPPGRLMRSRKSGGFVGACKRCADDSRNCSVRCYLRGLDLRC